VHIAFAWSRDTLVSVVFAVSARFTVLVLMCAFCASLVCVQFNSLRSSASFIVSLFSRSCVTGDSLITQSTHFHHSIVEQPGQVHSSANLPTIQFHHDRIGLFVWEMFIFVFSS